MQKRKKHTSKKLSKGARLRWASLKESASIKITVSMVNGRAVSEKEIKDRHLHSKDDISLLVP